MIWDRKIRSRIVFLSLVWAVVLSSCSSGSLDKLWLKSEGWSRGVLLGETGMAAPASIAFDSSNRVYSILFPKIAEQTNQYQPQLVILNENGELSDRSSLDFQISQPRQTRIFLTDDRVDLFWIDSHQLKIIEISKEGDLLSDIKVLSGEERVEHFEVIPWDDGYEIWYSGSQDYPGLYNLSGKLDDIQKRLIDPLGSRINVFLDSDNHLHASWVRYPKSYGEIEFYYLQTAPERSAEEPAEILFTTGVSPAIRIYGPIMGLDQDNVYLFWSEQITAGLDAGNKTTFIQSFPIGHPEQITPPAKFYVPSIHKIDTEPFHSGIFQSGERIPLNRSAYPVTYSLENIGTIQSQFTEIAVVFRSRSEFKWRDFRNQVNIVYLADGKGTSYQPLSYTSIESYYPAVFYDQENDLYVTWLEKGETTYRVYLTTTDSDKKSSIDQVSLDDYLYLGAEGLFGLLAGAVLAPFAAAVWGGAGLFAFLFNVILSRFNHRFYRTLGEFLSIAGGVFIFWFVKMATLPGLKDGYVPFSAWIPRIPPGLETPLVVGVPILIGLISFTVAWVNTYGKKSGSPINFHFIYAALDALLSCGIYGILIYGSF